MARKPSKHGAVLLLYPGPVITAVSPGTGGFDPLLTGPIQQGFVDEGAVVVRVNAQDEKGQLPSAGFQAFQYQGLVPGQQGNGLGPAGAGVGSNNGATRLWMKEPDNVPPQWATRSISR